MSDTTTPSAAGMRQTMHHGYTHDRGGGRRCTGSGPVTEDWNRTNCPVCLQIRAEREQAAAAWNTFMGRAE